MSNKTVEFRQPTRAKVDEFVSRGSAAVVPADEVPAATAVSTKQLSVDIPAELHRDLRVECARLGIKNYEVVRKALEQAISELRARSSEQAAAWLAASV